MVIEGIFRRRHTYRVLRLRGEAELDAELDEHSAYELHLREPVAIEYNPAVPPETFDIIIDACHRSIYGLWRQVVEYFDAHLIGSRMSASFPWQVTYIQPPAITREH